MNAPTAATSPFFLPLPIALSQTSLAGGTHPFFLTDDETGQIQDTSSTPKMPAATEGPGADARKKPVRVTPTIIIAALTFLAENPKATLEMIGAACGVSRTTAGDIVNGHYEICVESGVLKVRLREALLAAPTLPIAVAETGGPTGGEQAEIGDDARGPFLNSPRSMSFNTIKLEDLELEPWRSVCYGCAHWGTTHLPDGVAILSARPLYSRNIEDNCSRPLKSSFFRRQRAGTTEAGSTCNAHKPLTENQIAILIPASERLS